MALLLPVTAAAEPPVVWQDFVVTDLAGHRWDAEALAGRVVLLDFWATWCAPCLAELPHQQEAWRRFQERGFLILGIALDEIPRRRLLAWLRRQGVEWPQVHLPSGLESPLARRFRVTALPRTVLVDRQGRVVAVDLGAEKVLALLPSLLPATDEVNPPPAPPTRGTAR